MPQYKGEAVRWRPEREAQPDRPFSVGDVEIRGDDPALRYYMQGAEILRDFKFDVRDPEVARKLVDWGRQQHVLAQGGATERKRGRLKTRHTDPDTAVVYYMRVGNRVKIGWTTNLKSRLAALMPEELMAVERGGPAVERQRHLQFDTLHTAGEWFRLEAPLTTHIELVAQVTAHFKRSS